MKKILPNERVRDVCAELELPMPEIFIFVDTAKQTLALYKNSIQTMTCAISTSRFGIGNKENSYMTPPGLHRVEEKFGHGAKPWSIFKNREDTGVIWTNGMDEENQILTRILRLRGLEPGVNAGTGIDSYDRFIYIHGTNNETMIGTPMSHGCVCMKNDDIARLFDMVDIGTMVYIDFS